MAAFELELPGVFLDNLIEDSVPAVVGLTPTLINMSPEPGEAFIPKTTNIELDIATLGLAGTIDTANTKVYVNGVLAFNGGVFIAPFDGGASAFSNPVADVLRIVIDPTSDFSSEEVVSVRVVSNALGDPGILDQTYQFTIADTTPPRILSAKAVDLKRVRVTFSENVLETDAADSALDPDNWELQRLGDWLVPVVSANVVGVEIVTTASVDLLTDIELTPNGNYRVIGTVLEDLNGNAIVAPNNTADFLGWLPPSPEEREFDLYQRLPGVNRREDDSQDLFRFIGCFQEVLTLLLYDVDRFTDILDPDLAPEDVVDAMLADLGNPFAFDLSLADKRRLVQILTDMYRLKGTAPGIQNVVRFFLGLEVDVIAYNNHLETWSLGDSELGDTTILGTNVSFLLYCFEIVVGVALTDEQRKQLIEIAEYMKPAHTHLIRVTEPEIPEVLDHWELGLSELGESSFLH